MKCVFDVLNQQPGGAPAKSNFLAVFIFLLGCIVMTPVVVHGAPPTTPTNMVAYPYWQCESGKIIVEWTGNPDATSYEVLIDGVTVVDTWGNPHLYNYGNADSSAHFYQVRSINSDGSSAWTAPSVSATAPPECPDLVSQNLTLSSGPYTEGAPISLTAEVQNISNVASGVDFSDDFTYKWDGQGGWSSFSGNTLAKTALGASSASADGPVNFTPDRGGTLYIQHCVDSANVINEGTDETPNCTVSAGVVVSGDTPPTINAGSDRPIAPPVATSTPSGASASDVEGPVTLTWTYVNGPGPVPLITSGDTLNPEFSGMTIAGSYKFRLRATDNSGLTSDDYMYVVSSPLILNVASGPVSLDSGTLTQHEDVTFKADVINGTGVASGVFTDNFTYRWGGSGGWTQFGPDIVEASLSQNNSESQNFARTPSVLERLLSAVFGGTYVHAAGPDISRTDISASFTLDNSGTLEIQHCVDSAPSVLTESNEDDNCEIEVFMITAAEPDCGAQIISECELSETPYDANTGSCIDSGTCNYRCGTGGVWEFIEESCVPPTIPTFEICDDGGGGCVVDGGIKTVDPGTQLDIAWDSDDATSCDAVLGTGFGTGAATVGTDDIAASVIPNTIEEYKIACRYNSGIPVESAVTVVTNIVVPDLTTLLRTVREGDPVTLNWDTNNGAETSCTLTGGALNGNALLSNGTGDNETGFSDVTILGRTTFILTCGGLSSVKTIEIIPSGWEG